jgi:cephalosporin-C deacetylase
VPHTDLPLDELRAYQPTLQVPDDLEDFWAATLAETRAHAIDATFTRVDARLRLIDTFDVSFRGFAGDLIRGWLRLPAGASGRCPRWSSTWDMAAAAACHISSCCGRTPATPIW